jgi:hypothetical protein
MLASHYSLLREENEWEPRNAPDTQSAGSSLNQSMANSGPELAA